MRDGSYKYVPGKGGPMIKAAVDGLLQVQGIGVVSNAP